MKRIHAQFIRELRKAVGRPDSIPELFRLCYVRFLYHAHMIGH
jgi:hypothetical protein